MKSDNVRKRKEREYTSFEEFERRFFPASDAEAWAETADPRVFGVKLARESVNKVRHLLCPK